MKEILLTPSTTRHCLGLLLAALATLCVSATHGQTESLVAVGRIDSTGVVLNSATTVGGLVSAMNPETGRYTIEVTAPGAFAGASPEHFIPLATTNSTGSNDDVPYTSIDSVTDDTVTLNVWIVDVEDDTNINFGEARNFSFFFALHRLPVAGPLSPDTPLLLASGRGSASGSFFQQVAVDGIDIDLQSNGTGDCNVTLTKPEAFAGDSSLDYVTISSIYSSPLQDRTVRAGTVSVASDDAVIFNFHTDDVQDEVDDNNPVEINSTFLFQIYRIGPGAAAAPAKARMNVALFSVDGATGDITSGSTIYPEATVTSTRIGAGDYRIDIEAPGRFRNEDGNNYMPLTTVHSAVVIDEVVNARAVRINDDLLIIDVATGDVETSGQSAGVEADSDFFLNLQYSNEVAAPDALIGKRRSAAKMKGDGIRNKSAVGQKLRVKSSGPRAKFFFAVGNDGNTAEPHQVRQLGKAKGVKVKFFRLSGGRANVTGQVKAAGYTTKSLSPGRNVVFQAKTRLGKDRNRGKVRLNGSTAGSAERDVVLARLKELTE